MTEPILQVRDLSVRYGGVLALSSVSIVMCVTVIVLVGPKAESQRVNLSSFVLP